MNGAPEPAIPCFQPGMLPFVDVESDRIYLDGYGCLTWHFEVMGALYRVSRAESYSAFPPLGELLVYRIQDRHRLWQWLANKDRPAAPAGFRPPPAPKPPINPQYDPANLERAAAARECEERERQKRANFLNQERRRLEAKIQLEQKKAALFWAKPENVRRRSRVIYWLEEQEERNRSFGAVLSSFVSEISDHAYIQAMFDLYSQQRYRVL